MDSMAVYRHMDIGTAKPNAEERSVVPHHLIDLVDPSSEFSVSEYVNIVNTVVQDIQSRGRIALFVGGTGLYLRSLLRGVFDGPEADEELREKLEAQRLTKGNACFFSNCMKLIPFLQDAFIPMTFGELFEQSKFILLRERRFLRSRTIHLCPSLNDLLLCFGLNLRVYGCMIG